MLSRGDHRLVPVEPWVANRLFTLQTVTGQDVERLDCPTQTCCLAHITTQLAALVLLTMVLAKLKNLTERRRKRKKRHSLSAKKRMPIELTAAFETKRFSASAATSIRRHCPRLRPIPESIDLLGARHAKRLGAANLAQQSPS